MTQENLDSLDGDLKAGNISEDEYMQILTDEVVRLHPEIDAYEIDNMVRLQLKSLAIDEQYCADNERTEEPKEIGQLESKDGSCGGGDADEKDAGAKEQSRDLKASSSGNEQQAASEDDGNAQEKKAGENQQSSSSENGESQGPMTAKVKSKETKLLVTSLKIKSLEVIKILKTAMKHLASKRVAMKKASEAKTIVLASLKTTVMETVTAPAAEKMHG